MMHHFGFGDFIFRDDDGEEVGCVQNLTELEEQLEMYAPMKVFVTTLHAIISQIG